MYEFGIILWPDSIVELIKMHNPSYIPLDARVVGFRIDALESMIEIDFMTGEDLGEGSIPIQSRKDRLKVN